MRDLTGLFDREGTDKGRWYGGLYDVLLAPHRETIRCVVEIGIGTMIPGADSSMVGWSQDHYRPGGSLRAWRDFFPRAEIHGVDPAPDTQLIGEPRIHTHLCDSRNAEQVSEVLAALKHLPDLIIDDGLHDAPSQMATLRNFLPALRPGGLYVVEDVLPANVQQVLNELAPRYWYFVDRSWGECVAIVIRSPTGAG